MLHEDRARATSFGADPARYHGTGDRFAVAAGGLRASGRFDRPEERRYHRTVTYETVLVTAVRP